MKKRIEEMKKRVEDNYLSLMKIMKITDISLLYNKSR